MTGSGATDRMTWAKPVEPEDYIQQLRVALTRARDRFVSLEQGNGCDSAGAIAEIDEWFTRDATVRGAGVEVVAWVNRLGGNAVLKSHDARGPRIYVTGSDGALLVVPGDTVVDTGEWFDVDKPGAMFDYVSVRLFRVVQADESSTT